MYMNNKIIHALLLGVIFGIFMQPGNAMAFNPDSLLNLLESIHTDTGKLTILNQIIENSEDDTQWPVFNDRMGSLAFSLLDNNNLTIQRKAKEYYSISLNNKGYLFNKQGKYAEAMPFYLKSLEYSKEIHDTESISNTINNIAVIYQVDGKPEAALNYYQESYKLSLAVGSETGAAQALHNIAFVYEGQGNLVEAIANYEKCIRLLKKTGDLKYLGNTLNNLGVLFRNQGEFKKAIDYFNEGISVFQKLDDKNGIAKIYHNIGSTFREEGKLDEAMRYSNDALKIRKEINDMVGLGYTLNNIGLIYYQKQMYPEALKYMEESLDIRKQIGDMEGLAHSYTTSGETLFRLHRTEDALRDALKGHELAIHMKKPAIIEKSAHLLRNIYKEKGQFETALKFADLQYKMHDSIVNENNHRSLIQQKYTYETEKKEEQIKLLNSENERKDLALQKQSIVRNSLIAGTIFIIAIGFFFVNRIQLRKRIEKQQAIIEERRRISADMHDDLGSNLSKISLLSDALRLNTDNSREQTELEKISSTARGALEKMSEIVWTLNPKNDKLANLLAYIRKYASEYFEPTNIQCKIHFPGEIIDAELTGEQRRNIFLTVKEALQNVAKHSGATLVEIIFSNSKESWELTIRDNGEGINTDLLGKRKDGTTGNGLASMKQRIEHIKGEFIVEIDNGTHIKIKNALTI